MNNHKITKESGIGVKAIQEIKAQKAKANISQPLPDWQIPKPYRKIENTVEEYRSSSTVTLPLYITVVDGKVTEIWYDDEYGIDRCLNASDFSVTYEPANSK